MTTERLLAFDESGNTGAELNSIDQPIFTLASVRLSIEEAESLKKILTYKNESDLKFNNIKRKKNYYKKIEKVLNHELVTSENIKAFVFHKKYCIWLHTVDRLFEPLAYDDDLDIYENGMNIALTNFLYYCTPVFCNEKLVERYYADFLNMFKARDEEAITKFYNTLNELITVSKDDYFSSLLKKIGESKNQIENILKDWHIYNIDNTLTGFMSLIDYWNRKTDKYFDAFVDDSKQLEHFKYLIDNITSINTHQHEIGSDRRTYQLPIKLKEIKFADSKSNVLVQIADIFAGSATYFYKGLINKNTDGELYKIIEQSKFINSIDHLMVWPHQAFTPKDLQIVSDGKTNLLDELVNKARK